MASEAELLRRAMTAALRYLDAGGLPNVEQARRHLREGLRTPRDDAACWAKTWHLGDGGTGNEGRGA